ncbi:hypothetical protein ISN44_As08g026460 [Arabidopsis suecica]|uniref:Uncharacterized protein n=1 Tax=Arabidopsis suecica TaxID=45249 RepID=A0A8T2BC39_ARASU|nr:hypothetical protein ISN44_As08g026460 [Arabidopsis suecica]
MKRGTYTWYIKPMFLWERESRERNAISQEESTFQHILYVFLNQKELQVTQFHMTLDKGTLVLLVQRVFHKLTTSLYDSFEVLKPRRPVVYHLRSLQDVNIQLINLSFTSLSYTICWILFGRRSL